MYCSSCGKSIPDESKFCLHCGAPVTADKPTSLVTPSDRPPQYIKGIGAALNDITDKNGNHGLQVWFELIDGDGKLTRADGKVQVVIRYNYSDTGGVSSFRKELQVRKEDFVRGDKDPKFYGYIFRHPQPIIPGRTYGWEIDVTFETTDGKKIQGKLKQ